MFQAAVDLLAVVGAYCPDTNRVMEFTREEVLKAAQQAPKAAKFGEGREAKTMYGRDVDEDSVPWIHVGGGIYTTDERIFLDTVEGLASINIVNSLSIPSILHLRGKLDFGFSNLDLRSAFLRAAGSASRKPTDQFNKK